MRTRTFNTLVTCLTWACLAAFPGPRGTASAQEVPYTGVVNQSQTDVRAGAAARYYRVGELEKGTLVKVEEVIVGWYKIVPPKGFNSYISKAFVDAKGNGETGVVNTDRTKVYAADVNGPAGSYRIQAILNEGDNVQIVDEEGSHYKVVAPEKAFVYLPPGSVRRAMAIEAAPEQPAEPKPEPVVEPEPQPKPEPVVEPEPTPEPEPAVETPAEPEPIVLNEPEPVAEPQPVAEPEPEPVVEAPVETPAEPEPVAEAGSDKALDQMLEPAEPAVKLPDNFLDLEKEVEKLRELPLEVQPLDAMIAAYVAVEAKGGLSQTQAFQVKSRLATLRHDKPLAEGLKDIADARKPIKTRTEPAGPEVEYDAVGRLLASSIYDGKTLPRMYRLTDPATGRALAYIRPHGNVNTTAYLGKLVGVKGEAANDPALKLYVITVEKIDNLEAAD